MGSVAPSSVSATSRGVSATGGAVSTSGGSSGLHIPGSVSARDLPGSLVDYSFTNFIEGKAFVGVYMYKSPITGINAKLHQIVLLDNAYWGQGWLQLEYFHGGVRFQHKSGTTLQRSGVEKVGYCACKFNGSGIASVLCRWKDRDESYNSLNNNCIDFAEEVIDACDWSASQHFASHLDDARAEARLWHGRAVSAGVSSLGSAALLGANARYCS